MASIACIVSYPRHTSKGQEPGASHHCYFDTRDETTTPHFPSQENYTLHLTQTLKHKGKVAKEEHGRQRQEAGPLGLPRWSDGPLHHAQIDTTERTKRNQYEHPKHYFQGAFIPRQGDEGKCRDQPQLAVGHHPYHGQGCWTPRAFSQVAVEILLGDEGKGQSVKECGTVPYEEPKGQPLCAFW